MRSNRLLPALALAAALAAPFAAPVGAQTYTFDVQYFGGGTTALAPGSDEPDGTNILPGDSFVWTIAAMNGDYWRVLNGGGFFPLMAFRVEENGVRTGDWTLTLFRNGASVFTEIANGSQQSFVHLGTNTINLATGFEFDVMRLDYLLTDAVVDGNPPPPNAGDETDTTIRGRLPIFGAPEQNRFSPGIQYGTFATVPEPSTYALLAGGLAMIGVVARRRGVRAAS